MPADKEPKRIQNRTLRAGDELLGPGDRVSSVYVVQSGKLAVFQNRASQLIEILQLAAPKCVAEEAVFGPVSWAFHVCAVQDTTVLEIPTSMIPEQIKATPPHTRELFKALNERAKALLTELRATRGDRGTTACPPDETAKTFAVLFHSLRITGKVEKKENSEITVANWKEAVTFAQEILDEDEARFESAAQILLRLKFAQMDSDTGILTVFEMRKIENFLDYYGGYHFKGGYSNLLKTNPKMTRIVEEMLKLTADPEIGAKVDRGGVAHIPYKLAVDELKAIIPGFEADQIFRLEQKGLFVKRTATNDGGVLSFLKMDFEQMLENWKVLREVEIWNEKGFVEPLRDTTSPQALEADRKRFAEHLAHWKPMASQTSGPPQIRTGSKKAGENWCEVCMSAYKLTQKVCEVCGSDLAKKAA